MDESSPVRLHDIVNLSLIAASKDNVTLVFWRHPSESIIHGIFGQGESINNFDLENSEPGFILHPFDQLEDGQSRFVPAEYQITLPLFGEIEINAENSFYQKIANYLSHSDRCWHINKNLPCTLSDEQSRYLELVQDSIRAIKEHRFDKVVAARTKHTSIDSNFSPGQFFRALIKAYPDAFVSCISDPQYGTWIGASPEILLEIDKNNVFRTIALAGTQKVNDSRDPAVAAWTQKEIQEQAMVSRFIINQFKKIRLREFVETGPQTAIAGNVMHLRTNYSVKLDKVEIDNVGTKMMYLLHPTSAVCGMPKKSAHEFILKEESFQRSLYSGFIGPVNIHGLTSLNVNLRTMQLFDTEAVIYAGNGITDDSDPEKEWLETELKCATLLQCLNQNAI